MKSYLMNPRCCRKQAAMATMRMSSFINPEFYIGFLAVWFCKYAFRKAIHDKLASVSALRYLHLGFISVIARLDHLDQAIGNAIKHHYDDDSFAASVKEGIRRADREREREI
jgi:hypothetical protein